MVLRIGIILWVSICSVVSFDPDLGARMEALEARAVRSERREFELEARVVKAEQEKQQLRDKLAIQNSSSFFSVQLTEVTTIPHGEILDFDDVIVNYGNDYIQSGGIYM